MGRGGGSHGRGGDCGGVVVVKGRERKGGVGGGGVGIERNVLRTFCSDFFLDC